MHVQACTYIHIHMHACMHTYIYTYGTQKAYKALKYHAKCLQMIQKGTQISQKTPTKHPTKASKCTQKAYKLPKRTQIALKRPTNGPKRPLIAPNRHTNHPKAPRFYPQDL